MTDNTDFLPVTPLPLAAPEPAANLSAVGRLNNADHRQVMRSARRNYEVYNAFGDRLHLADSLAGRSIFLLVNGPSLLQFDLTKLNQRGIVTMGLNNGPAVFKPTYWVGCDGPERFVEQIWNDASIMKFLPLAYKSKPIRLRTSATDETLIESPYAVDTCPNTFFFARSQKFDHEIFLNEPAFNWGCWNDQTDTLGIKGGRTTMLVALKLCFWLGARNCYIIGADFKMRDGEQNYAFEQERTPESVRGNNSTYRANNERFKALRPHFGAAGFCVYNCLTGSGLKAFAFKDYDAAVSEAAAECNDKPIVTEGLYE